MKPYFKVPLLASLMVARSLGEDAVPEHRRLTQWIAENYPGMSAITNATEADLQAEWLKPMVAKAQAALSSPTAIPEKDPVGGVTEAETPPSANGKEPGTFVRFIKGFQLRSSYSELGTEVKDSDPATFGFVQDFQDDSQTWIAKGAVGYPVTIVPDYQLIPGITFDRVTGGDDPTDSLTFRMGASATWLRDTEAEPGFFRWLDKHTLLLDATYATDFDFDSRLPGAEISWTPILDKRIRFLPMTRFGAVGNSGLEWRVGFQLHSEGGVVSEAGSQESLVGYTRYFRIGGNASMHWRHEKLEALSLFATATDYESLFDGSPSVRQIETGLAWRFGAEDSDPFSIRLEYRLGRIPITAQEVDQLTLQFAIKF